MADVHSFNIERSYDIVIFGRECLNGTGRTRCDFQDGTVMFLTPKHNKSFIARHCHKDGIILSFCPEYFDYIAKDCKISDFSMFKYSCRESLHISLKEKNILEKSVSDIQDDMNWGLDKYSDTLIVERIKILLNYCRRFYSRQFITRSCIYSAIMAKINDTVDEYIRNGHLKFNSDTSATLLKLSSSFSMTSAYLTDLIKHENDGITLSKFIQMRHLNVAKNLLLTTNAPIAEISHKLGFSTQQQFTAIFKKATSLTPSAFRTRAN